MRSIKQLRDTETGDVLKQETYPCRGFKDREPHNQFVASLTEEQLAAVEDGTNYISGWGEGFPD